jgi:outer membrane lipoprotein-sorting protein
MKGKQRLLALVAVIVAASAALAAGVAFGAEADQDVLKVLAEKVREREAAFDGVQAEFTGVGAIGGQPVGQLKGNWIKAGDKYRFQYDGTMQLLGVQYKESNTDVSDGEKSRVMYDLGEGPRGVIRRPEDMDYWKRARDASPDCLGITRLGQMSGRLSEILSGDSKAFAAKYGNDMFEGAELKVTARENETVGGRDCAVVECAQVRASDGKNVTYRLRFDGDLNYACVGIEVGEYKEGAFTVRGTVTMNDFREVKPGLWVPFSASLEGYSEEMKAMGTAEYRIEKLEFPAEFDESLFALEFPPGTVVYDAVVGAGFTMGGGIFIPPPLEGDAGEPGGGTEAQAEEIASSAEAPSVEPPAAVEEPAVSAEPAAEKNDGGKWLLAASLILGVIVVLAAMALLRKRTRS